MQGSANYAFNKQNLKTIMNEYDLDSWNNQSRWADIQQKIC